MILLSRATWRKVRPKNKLLRYDPRAGVVLCKAWQGAYAFNIDTGVGIKLSQITLGAAEEKTC